MGKNEEQAVALPPLPGELTPTSYTLPERGFGIYRWEKILGTLLAIEQSVQWWIGDALLWGRAHYHEMHSHALGQGGEYARSTLLRCASVAEQYAPDQRRENLSFTHHRLLVTHSQRDAWLDRCEQDNISCDQLSALLRQERALPGRALVVPLEVLDAMRGVQDNLANMWRDPSKPYLRDVRLDDGRLVMIAVSLDIREGVHHGEAEGSNGAVEIGKIPA